MITVIIIGIFLIGLLAVVKYVNIKFNDITQNMNSSFNLFEIFFMNKVKDIMKGDDWRIADGNIVSQHIYEGDKDA